MKRIIFYLAIFILLISLGNAECMSWCSNYGPATTFDLIGNACGFLRRGQHEGAVSYIEILENRLAIQDVLLKNRDADKAQGFESSMNLLQRAVDLKQFLAGSEVVNRREALAELESLGFTEEQLNSCMCRSQLGGTSLMDNNFLQHKLGTAPWDGDRYALSDVTRASTKSLRKQVGTCRVLDAIHQELVQRSPQVAGQRLKTLIAQEDFVLSDYAREHFNWLEEAIVASERCESAINASLLALLGKNCPSARIALFNLEQGSQLNEWDLQRVKKQMALIEQFEQAVLNRSMQEQSDVDNNMGQETTITLLENEAKRLLEVAMQDILAGNEVGARNLIARLEKGGRPLSVEHTRTLQSLRNMLKAQTVTN